MRRNNNVSIMLRLPEDVKAAAARLAEQDGRSLNGWMAMVIQNATKKSSKKAIAAEAE